MAQGIRALERGGLDVMLLTKTKVQSDSHNRTGYNLTCLAARPSSAGGAPGGVGIVTRERPVGWEIESTRYHGLNIVLIIESFRDLVVY